MACCLINKTLGQLYLFLQGNHGFHKRWGIYRLAKRLLACKEGLCLLSTLVIHELVEQQFVSRATCTA